MAHNIVIIGAGISGLATAALLAKEGKQVTILEKNCFTGGRASVYSQNGFVFDKGPSWYMMPEVFEHYFAQFNKKTSDYYEIKRLDTHYKVFFDHKKTYEIKSDQEANYTLFNQIEPGAGEKLNEYLATSKYIYEQSMKELVLLDYSSLTQLLNGDILKNIAKFNLFTDLHSQVKKYFTHKDLQKIVEFTTVFLGGSPYNTPAFYSLVAHADFNLGIYYPMGGIHKIIEALESLCKEFNVNILTNQDVKKIEIQNGTATAVITQDNNYTADIVISGADYHFVETKLIDNEYQTYTEKYWSQKTLSPSAYIIYLGLNKKTTALAHHNLYFNDSWETHFTNVFKKSSWPEHPSYYVHVPSLTDPTVAPEGKETLMFLVPIAPNLHDSDTIRDTFAEKILMHFEQLTGQKIIENIELKKIYSHRDFISEYNAYGGSAFGLAHTLLQTALFRPRNKSKKVQNLYYVGQYTNPGIGMPTCMLSAQIVTNQIQKEYGK